MSDPRNWNKYVYSYNNPLRYVDPDGQRPQDSFHNKMNKAVEDYAAGRIDEKQFWERVGSGPAVGTLAGLAVGGTIAGGGAAARLWNTILLWAARNPDKAQKITEGLVGTSTGGPVGGGVIAGPYGKTTAATLESLASSGGSTVAVVTKLTQAPIAGRALSTSVGHGAEALSGKAREIGQLYRAEIPKALLTELLRVGLAIEKKTYMKGVVATEIRFLPEATKYIVNFFK